MSATLTSSTVAESEQHLVLHGINWGQYVTISDALPDWPGLRMIFTEGRLTFLVTSRRHDWLSERLGDLIKAVAEGSEILWEVAGQATFQREDQESGVEGDKTYYFGEHAEQMLGPQNIDLTTQPPPDLAVEVEVSHPADDAMRVYGRLGVPEVWRLNVERWSFGSWVRREDGIYAPADRSAALPLLTAGDILGQLHLAEQLGSSRWHARLREWVRDVLLPR